MSSQLVIKPFSIGLVIYRPFLLEIASLPTKTSFYSSPILEWALERPMIVGIVDLGASSPANPTLHVAVPTSMHTAVTSSSIFLMFQ